MMLTIIFRGGYKPTYNWGLLQPVSPPNTWDFGASEAPRTVKTVASPTSAAVSAMKLLSCEWLWQAANN